MEQQETTHEPIRRLRADLRKAAASAMSIQEARYLVDLYYQMQDFRVASAAEVRAMSKSGEPVTVVDWVLETTEAIEAEIKKALEVYTDAHAMGRWSKGVIGIGPVIAAGLLAHIDVTKTKTVGGLWRFAGLDPTSRWNKKEKRPWNAKLKVLCWKCGESFVKQSGRPESLYGRLWVERKELETRRNLAGELAEQARTALERKRIGKDTEAYLWYSGCLTRDAAEKILSAPAEKRGAMVKQLAGEPDSGTRMLPPAHTHARAKRWAVKVFLCHYWEESYRQTYGKEPPEIYSITMLGHAHKIEPENSIKAKQN